MPLNIPKNLYTAGAVEFDSSPSLQFYAQHLARKQAKEDALDEYYRKLPISINKEGFRQDIDGEKLKQMVAEYQQHYFKNRDDILRGGKSRYEQDRMAREMEDLIYNSKQAGKESLEFGKNKFDPAKSWLFDDDEVINAIKLHDLPIGDPNRKSIMTMASPVKPFSQDDYSKKFEDIKMSEQEPVVIKNPSDMTLTTVKKSSYDTEALNAIRNRAISDYETDRSFRNHINKIVDKKENLAELNKIYKETFGKEIESYHDMATAYTLQLRQPSITKQSVTPDTFERQKYMEAIKQGNRVQLAYLRNNFQQMKEDQKENRLNVILQGYIDDANKNPGGEITINPIFKKELTTFDDFGEKTQPEKVRIVGDKVEYQYPSGKTESIGLQDFKGVMRKVMNQPVSNEDATTPTPTKPKTTTSSYNIKGKKYSESELLKMGYTKEQIAPYKQK